MAELLEALDTVHRCGFVHRDVKPDNAVLNADGHLKLLDFGLTMHQPLTERRSDDCSKHVSKRTRRTQMRSTVGTPEYMAPEVFKAEYGKEADLWSLGIVTYECLVGHVPFHAGKRQGPEAVAIIKERIVKQHPELLEYQLQKAVVNDQMTLDAARFLMRVVCVARYRLTAEQIRAEPFFAGVDFATLHATSPPIVPDVSGPDDCKWFDDFDPAPLLVAQTSPCSTAPKDVSLEWSHYEFDKDVHVSQLPVDEVDTLHLEGLTLSTDAAGSPAVVCPSMSP